MRTEFLYASIADTQSTIRSIDVRAGFLFVVLFIPLSLLDKVRAILAFPAHPAPAMTVWCVVALAVWLLAIIALFRTVVAIDNPSKHVTGPQGNGSFYSADLFSLNISDVYRNRRTLSSRTVEEERSILPSDDTELEIELTTEKMKLAYIRAMKIKRLTTAAWLTLVWITLSGGLAGFTRLYSWL